MVFWKKGIFQNFYTVKYFKLKVHAIVKDLFKMESDIGERDFFGKYLVGYGRFLIGSEPFSSQYSLLIFLKTWKNWRFSGNLKRNIGKKVNYISEGLQQAQFIYGGPQCFRIGSTTRVLGTLIQIPMMEIFWAFFTGYNLSNIFAQKLHHRCCSWVQCNLCSKTWIIC